MSFEGVEPATPELAVWSEPGVQLRERLGPQPIPAPPPLWPHAHQAGLAKHPEVLRDAGLAETEALDELADTALTVTKQLEDATAHRLGQGIEGGGSSGGGHVRTYYPTVMYLRGNICGMRAPAALTAAAIVVLAAAASVAAQTTQTVTAAPTVVDSTAVQTVRGRNWPVFENCSRTIRAFVRSDQNSVPIAQRHIPDSGNFTFRWIPRNKNVGPGRWRLVVRMRCESGRDGSTFFVRAGTAIRVRP